MAAGISNTLRSLLTHSRDKVDINRDARVACRDVLKRDHCPLEWELPRHCSTGDQDVFVDRIDNDEDQSNDQRGHDFGTCPGVI